MCQIGWSFPVAQDLPLSACVACNGIWLRMIARPPINNSSMHLRIATSLDQKVCIKRLWSAARPSWGPSDERRKGERGPVALCHWLLRALPLSPLVSCPAGGFCQFGKILNDFRFGSVAVVQTHSSPMAGLGQKADIQPGRMSALTNTGRSAFRNPTETNGS